MTKNTKILLGVFVVLLGVYLLFFRGKDRVSSDNVETKLFTADSSKIDKIEIVKTSGSMTLEKINGQWVVTKPVNYPADTNAITPLLGGLKNMRIEGVASANVDKFPTYLDSANHTVVTAYQEGKLLGTFEVGKMAVSQENSYIKLPNDNRILIGSGINAAYFSRGLKDYRSKYITSIQTAGIKSIKFQSTDSNKVDYEIIQDSANHWVIGKDSVQHVLIDAVVNLFGNMFTDDFIDTPVTTPPTATMTITITGTQPLTVNFYKDNSNPAVDSYIMTVSGVKQVFRVPGTMAGSWFKKKSEMLPPPVTNNKTPDQKPPDTKKKK